MKLCKLENALTVCQSKRSSFANLLPVKLLSENLLFNKQSTEYVLFVSYGKMLCTKDGIITGFVQFLSEHY